MSWVVARPGESFESLLRRFKKAVEHSGVLADYRKHEVYEKPSVKRKRKQAAAKKRAMKHQKKIEGRAKFGAKKNLNFRWNKDHTQKIYSSNKPNFNKRPYDQKQGQKPPVGNQNKPQYHYQQCGPEQRKQHSNNSNNNNRPRFNRNKNYNRNKPQTDRGPKR